MYSGAVKTPQTPKQWAREKQITEQYGLTHMILYDLRIARKIRTVSLKQEGKKYGARLYNIASIEDFLASQEALESQTEVEAAGRWRSSEKGRRPMEECAEAEGRAQ